MDVVVRGEEGDIPRDGEVVPRSRQHGWDYRAASNSIIFYDMPVDPANPSAAKVDVTPPVGSIVRDPDAVFEALLQDPNPNDLLYVRWLIDYPPYDAETSRIYEPSPLPNPEQPAVFWPQALRDGQPVNLRHLTDNPNPNVVSVH